MGSRSESSEALLSAAQSGDSAALDALLQQHRAGIYRYGLHVCRTSEDAEDAVQLTLWAATRSIATFRRASSITTWLFTIVHNYCHRLLSRGRWSTSLEPFEAALADLRPLADEELAARQLGDLLGNALSQLEPQHREVIVLRDVQGFSAPEAADMLDISIPALKSRLHRGREQLRHLLESHFRPATDAG